MSNKIVYPKKRQPYLLPLASSFLGFLLGISGVSNHLLFEHSENLLKAKLPSVTAQATELSFIGFRTLFLAYLGLSAGLTASHVFKSKEIQHKR